jgi:hypothetical protein
MEQNTSGHFDPSYPAGRGHGRITSNNFASFYRIRQYQCQCVYCGLDTALLSHLLTIFEGCNKIWSEVWVFDDMIWLNCRIFIVLAVSMRLQTSGDLILPHMGVRQSGRTGSQSGRTRSQSGRTWSQSGSIRSQSGNKRSQSGRTLRGLIDCKSLRQYLKKNYSEEFSWLDCKTYKMNWTKYLTGAYFTCECTAT